MAKLINRNQRVLTGVKNPESGYSRVFGLACKAAAGVGVDDLAYSPPVGSPFWLRRLSLWFGSEDPTANTGGTVYIAAGTGIPTAENLVQRWDLVVPFWAGTTKPALMVRGAQGFLTWPMNRLYTGEALRFGMVIENGYAVGTFWVNTWFEISEG